jgi:sigma-54 dependent transcriptional regulator, acetoin dehydrogenase operon transcriptional activator AcoR
MGSTREKRNGIKGIPQTELSPEDTAALLDRERDLIEAAIPYLMALSRAANRHCHAAMLADRDARVLHVIGDDESVSGPEQVPGPGVLLSEMSAGSRNLAAPLSEPGYVELVAPEHFLGRSRSFTCQGVPLRGSTGELVGVLGISVRRQEAADKLRDILICAARGIEADLLARDLGRAIDRLQHYDSADAYIKVREDIVQLQAAARLRFETAAQRASIGHTNTSIRDLLATSVRLVEEFHKRASLCRTLVSERDGALRPVNLERSACELLELLGTEAAIRGVDVVLLPGARITLVTDARAVSRALWHTLVEMLERAEPHDVIEVMVAEAIGDAARILCQVMRNGSSRTSLQLLVQATGDSATLDEDQ